APERVTMGEMPVVPPPPDPEALMGNMAPPPEIEMGAAVAELKEPCEPEPGFAARPPEIGQAKVELELEPPMPRMGDVAAPEPIAPPEPPPPPVLEQPRTTMGRMAPSRPMKSGGAILGDL